MLNFQPITFERRQELEPILQALPDMGCEYSFANLMLWGDACAAVEDGTLPMERIDEAVLRVLRVKVQLGLL